MANLYRYRIFCETSSQYEYVWREEADGPPTTCPVDTAHTINVASITIDQTRTDQYPTDADGHPVFVVKEDTSIYKIEYLLLNGSRDLNVNGSSTQQVFSFAPGNGETWLVEKILFGMDDVAVDDYEAFAGLSSALANGLLLQIKIGGTVYDCLNITDNADLFMMFPKGLATQLSSLLGSSSGYYGELTPLHQIKLQASSSDLIQMVVRDNLSGVTILRCAVVLRRVI